MSYKKLYRMDLDEGRIYSNEGTFVTLPFSCLVKEYYNHKRYADGTVRVRSPKHWSEVIVVYLFKGMKWEQAARAVLMFKRQAKKEGEEE